MPRVETVATGYHDEVDHYVVCECGWVSLPTCRWPSRLSCEACEVRAEGGRNRLAYWTARQREAARCAAVVRMPAARATRETEGADRTTACEGCITATHCEHFATCLAECVPGDLAKEPCGVSAAGGRERSEGLTTKERRHGERHD